MTAAILIIALLLSYGCITVECPCPAPEIADSLHLSMEPLPGIDDALQTLEEPRYGGGMLHYGFDDVITFRPAWCPGYWDHTTQLCWEPNHDSEVVITPPPAVPEQ